MNADASKITQLHFLSNTDHGKASGVLEYLSLYLINNKPIPF